MSNRLRIISSVLLISLSLFQYSGIEAGDELGTGIRLTTKTVDSWLVVESPNFKCRSKLPPAEAERLALSCEAWRKRVCQTWFPGTEESTWQPKCEVCVHADRAAYNFALGRHQDTSVGSTMIRFEQERPVVRRIDVRADAVDWSNAALPHELTHVVFAERFGGHALPRWADEGIAMLSESPDKHRDRLTNLREVLSKKGAIPLSELVRFDRIPSADRRDAFYSQSVALTSMLVRRSTPAQFAAFIQMSQQNGLDAALKHQYKLDGITALQKEWDRLSTNPNSIELVSLQLHDGLNPIIASAENRTLPKPADSVR